MRVIKVFLFFFLTFFLIFSSNIFSQQIYVEANKFKVNGNLIYLNGCNIPWNNWNDFGGKYDPSFWESEFKRISEKGINSVRIWISCDGDIQPEINDEGFITGVSQAFWKDVDDMMLKAKKYNLYVIATMMSFDHTKNTHKKFLQWRDLLNDSLKVRSYINNYLVPFAVRYKNNPFLFSIDLCNEMEWIQEKEECGNLRWNVLQRYVAMCAAAIHHSGSKILVTLGSAGVKWNSEKAVANFWSDKNLQLQYNDKKAYLDFWQIHYYSWINQYFSNPFTKSPVDYEINDRPVIIGEMPAKSDGLPFGLTMLKAFENAFNLGYCGHFPWTSNGVDKIGNLDDFADASLTFVNNHNLKH